MKSSKVKLYQNIVTEEFRVIAPNFMLYTKNKDTAVYWFKFQLSKLNAVKS